MSDKKTIGYILISVWIAIPIFYINTFYEVNPEKELKYDMTYGLTIYPAETKEKTIVLKENLNNISVVPDNLKEHISCEFFNSEGYLLDSDLNVSGCELLVESKSTKTVVVKIRHSKKEEVSVELKHKAK